MFVFQFSGIRSSFFETSKMYSLIGGRNLSVRYAPIFSVYFLSILAIFSAKATVVLSSIQPSGPKISFTFFLRLFFFYGIPILFFSFLFKFSSKCLAHKVSFTFTRAFSSSKPTITLFGRNTAE